MHVFALMNRWMVMVMLALFAALALIVLATSAGSAQEAVRFRVTITNATSPEMTITPGAYLVHSTSDAFWAPGASANLALERIAEIGDPAEAVASLGAVALGAAPAGGDSVVIEFTATPGDQFSFAQMLIASNDGFIGLASMPLFSGSQPTNGTFALIGWDAGTEANTALFSGFEGGQPDPPQGAANVENGTPTSEPIAAHPQFTGVQATAAIVPIAETITVPAGLSSLGWTGGATTSAAFLDANPGVERVFWRNPVTGTWLLDSRALPDIIRTNFPITRGAALFVVTAAPTEIAIDLTGPAAAPLLASLRLDLTALAPLSSGHYEGWAIFGETKVSTGKFNLDGDGALVSLASAPIERFATGVDLRGADSIVITIEADGDVDTVPSGIVVLAGALTGTSAVLSYPVDLSSVAGGYILATPTDLDATNETAGVWFLIPGAGAALSLPSLPDGWTYEGWGVTQGTPLSSGRFLTATGADLDAPFSGPYDSPPFPGEDFVANLPAAIIPPVDLADGASVIVISVEPDLDGIDPTGPAPFSIKPLVGAVPAGLADHAFTAMDQDLSSVPTGVAVIE